MTNCPAQTESELALARAQSPGFCVNRLIWDDQPRKLARTVKSPAPCVSWRKVGGLHHWRLGRLGGSFYIARKPVPSGLDSPHAVMVTRFSPLPAKPASEPRKRLSVGAETALWCVDGAFALAAGFLTVTLLFG